MPQESGASGACPFVLRHKAEDNPQSRKSPYCHCYSALSGDFVSAAPDVVQKHIECRHRHGGDKFSDSKSSGVAFKSGGAQSDSPRHQVERVTRAERHRHNSVEGDTVFSPCFCRS